MSFTNAHDVFRSNWELELIIIIIIIIISSSSSTRVAKIYEQ